MNKNNIIHIDTAKNIDQYNNISNNSQYDNKICINITKYTDKDINNISNNSIKITEENIDYIDYNKIRSNNEDIHININPNNYDKIFNIINKFIDTESNNKYSIILNNIDSIHNDEYINEIKSVFETSRVDNVNYILLCSRNIYNKYNIGINCEKQKGEYTCNMINY